MVKRCDPDKSFEDNLAESYAYFEGLVHVALICVAVLTAMALWRTWP